MSASRLAGAAAACWLFFLATGAVDAQAPSFTSAGVVNAATGQPALAPYSICTVYGADLFLGGTASASGLTEVPNSLAGVRVNIGALLAGVLYVSSNQVNFLLPNSLTPGKFSMRVSRDGLTSPAIPIVIDETAPGLFTGTPGFAAATHADGSPLTETSPAVPGEVIVIYGTGLGRTRPDPTDRAIATTAAPILHSPDFQLLLDSTPLDPSLILYVGLAPGFAGLYQVNIRLPDPSGPNPEVRINVAGVLSSVGVRLPVTPSRQP